MPKDRSWWRLRQVRHRDAAALAFVSGFLLLAGSLGGEIQPSPLDLYNTYIAPNLKSPEILALLIALLIIGFTTVFGGIFVLLGGIHFTWGRVGRGRFLMGLGLGVSLLGLLSRFARTILTTGTPFGDPLHALLLIAAGYTGAGLLLGLASHTLMGRYALMLKKHARRVIGRWRRARRSDRTDH
jgi:hypothetical protein